MRNLRDVEARIRRLEADLAATGPADAVAMEIFQALKDARAEHAEAIQERLEAQTFGERPKAARLPDEDPEADQIVRLWRVAVQTQRDFLASDRPCPLGRRIGEHALLNYRARLADAEAKARRERWAA